MANGGGGGVGSKWLVVTSIITSPTGVGGLAYERSKHGMGNKNGMIDVHRKKIKNSQLKLQQKI